MKPFRLGLPLVSSILIASAVACSGDKAPARGQIMLALHTDMALPKDIAKVKLQVLTDGGVVKFDQTFFVGADGSAKIPATFAIVGPSGKSPTVEVRVIGIGRTGKGRTFSKVITTVPRDRIATLNVPIQWLCDGSANTIDVAGEDFDNNCLPVGETETACVAGTCQDVNFPETSMPDFSPPEIFGGGEDGDDPTGKCFDTVACFDPGFAVTPNGSCRVTLSAPPKLPLNFALRPTTPKEGICGVGSNCYVPLDQSPTFGFSEVTGPGMNGGGGASGSGDELPGAAGSGGAGGAGLPDFGTNSVQRTFQLPKAVCDRIQDGRVAQVWATAACDLKTARLPVCGDWYSVSAQKVNPETSTTTQMGSMGGSGSCPEFKPGSGIPTLSEDPLYDGTVQAAADLKAHADELAKEMVEACAGIIADLGGTPPVAAVTPTASDVNAACMQAQTELKTAGSGTLGNTWSVLVTPAKCGLSLDDQATCEASCPKTGCGTLVSADKRCSTLGGSCAGSCSGSCAGSHDEPVTCKGECQGICNGGCSGSCILTDGSVGGASCGGWCDATCTGTCAGTCTPQAGETCEKVCWTETGDCIGTLTELVCQTPLDSQPCFGDCGKLCAARASLESNVWHAEHGSLRRRASAAAHGARWPLLEAVRRHQQGFSRDRQRAAGQ
ncbi:MAG: hypothetical protein QM756_41255 [Polyangiaceae bacterium]